jgi:signal peptidase I
MSSTVHRRATATSRSSRNQVREYVEAALWALVLTLFLRAFVIQAFRIPSESMLDTLRVGDFLFVNKFEYGPKIPFTHIRMPGLRQPTRGDVIVFQYPVDPSKDFIKRCIGTPGHTVEVKEKQVLVDHQALVEPYVIHIDPTVRPAGYDFRDFLPPKTIPPGELFMMGDNRDNSNDSRFWGNVKMDLVKGRAMFIYWSWDADRHWPRWNRIFRPIH